MSERPCKTCCHWHRTRYLRGSPATGMGVCESMDSACYDRPRAEDDTCAYHCELLLHALWRWIRRMR